MSKIDDPLNEVSLNTPLSNKILPSEGTLKVEKHKLRLSDSNIIYEGSYRGTIDANLRRLTEFVKLLKFDSSDLQTIHDCILNLYGMAIHIHSILLIKQLVKLHLMLISKCLNHSQFGAAATEAITLYNFTNSYNARNLTDILLSDRLESNEYYLSTLKILILQILIKNKTYESHDISIVKLFSNDQRFLLNDPKMKINIVIKLLLNFYTILPKFKVLFGLKFLQYLSQFNLKFESYIKTLDQDTFQKQLILISSNSPLIYPHLNSFYLDYSKHDKRFKKIMVNQLTNEDIKTRKQITNINELIELSKCPLPYCSLSVLEMDNLLVLSNSLLKSEQLASIVKFQTSKYIWNVIYKENYHITNKERALLDKTLIFINSQITTFSENPSELLAYIEILSEYCYNKFEFKRLSNLVNITFNSFITLKNNILLNFATKLEIKRYMLSDVKESISYTQLIRKLEKFIQSTPELSIKKDIFSRLFNINIIWNVETLSDILDFSQKCSLHCFKRLKLNHSIQINYCSEFMLCVLYTDIPAENVDTKSWSSLTTMLYACLSGDLGMVKSESTLNTSKHHFLNRYEILINSVYYFNLEMSKHSSSNLALITSTYISKWIEKSSNLKERISTFECEFVNTLLLYLSFNKFHKVTIELTTQMETHKRYFEPILLEQTNALLNALINLQMTERVKAIETSFVSIKYDFKILKLEKLLVLLDIHMKLQLWGDKCDSFETLFIQDIPECRNEILSIRNNLNIPFSQYIKILLFNVKLHSTASRLHMHHDSIISAITEAKMAVKLSMSMIESQKRLSQPSRLLLIKLLTESYINLINLYITLGIGKDTEFYVKELSRVICDLGEPTMVFESLNFLHNYYTITEQDSLREITLQKVNKTFTFINAEHDIQSLTKFLYVNNELEKLNQSMVLFFSDDIKETFFPQYWKLKVGYTVDDQNCLPELKYLNSINNVNKTYKHVLNQLELDPFFKGMFESALSVPSCKENLQVDLLKARSLENGINNRLAKITDSPRSSNMTPKSKHMRQKFDRIAAINNLQRIISTMEKLDIKQLDHIDLSKVASMYSLCSAILSNINKETVDDLLQKFYLSDLSKSMPLFYDKMLTTMDKTLYSKFKLLSLNQFNEEVKTERNNVLQAQSDIQNDPEFPFNIISIDICPVTGNLLLSKYVPLIQKRFYLTIPLNGINARDLDALHLTFEDATCELNTIIQESNMTTSSDVTNKINNSEGRKKWWEKRYELDKRLEDLLNKIENTWFNGFKGFFSTTIPDAELFAEFKNSFYQILHQTLPSRKQVSSPDSFLKMEDWILELFLGVNPYDGNFLSIMEDLIYFVLDILLYHGEENAYDEIDISLLHVQLEESIKKYHSKVSYTNVKKISHTFLIVSSKCHLFPWESLSFLKGISTSRVPSFSSLSMLLKRNSSKCKLEVPLDRNISMILNPNGDLKRSEEMFKNQFVQIVENTLNSKLVVNHKPTEQEFLDMMSTSNLFIYVGHSGGEQYARLNEIKKFNTIAPSFLLGCSSASMKYYGNIEPTGTIYSYLLGGCPLVLGNLWDVTDKDIDKFSTNVFEKTGVIKGIKTELFGYKPVCEAINESRDVCHLKYLNGAAPVIYGLPAIFK